MKISLPVVLSLNGGYLDTAGFLALRGLFTAHVTGNFVTFGAAVVQGSSGAIAKLLALPVFCAIIVVTRLIGRHLEQRGANVLRTMLSIKVILLVLGAVLAIALGPFASGDAGGAILTGMCFVAAMAIQNAAHRIHFPTAPPTTLMTGTTTQIMIDVADCIRGVPPEQAPAIRARLHRMSKAVAAFALGCGSAALLFYRFGDWCFAVAPFIGAISLISTPPAPAAAKA
jgi:uncharacterized membrane protein YoaK (UPF0700 family)